MINAITVQGHNPLKFKNLTKDCVYIMEDEQTNILYVGRSSRLKTNGRMRTHERTSWFFHEVENIYIIPFDSYADMCIHEILYINLLKPKYNKDNYQGEVSLCVKLHHERLHYYTKGSVCREYKGTLEDFDRKSNQDRLEDKKHKFENTRTKAGLILEVFKEGEYKCSFICSVCGGKGTSSLSNLNNGYTKSCGCLSKMKHTSPYYKEYQEIIKTIDMGIEKLQKWRKRYNSLCRRFRYRNKKELPVSFKDYVLGVYNLGLNLESIGNSKGKYCFCFKDNIYKKV